MTREPAKGWLNPGFSALFLVKRLALALVLALGPLALCLAARQGVLGLFMTVPGLWPYRFKIVPEAAGLRVSWLFISTILPWNSLVTATVGPDPRPWVIGKRRRVLRIARQGNAPLLVRAPPVVLERLASDVGVALRGR